MQEHKEEENKKESTHPIIVWIIASILFHALLALISIVLHIDDYRDANITKKDDRFLVSQQEKNTATMMLDQVKKTTAKTVEKKTEQPIEKQVKPEDPKLIHTLIPGRKGLDEQNITDQLSNAQGEKPKNIIPPKPVKEKKQIPVQEPKKIATPKSEPIQKPVIEKSELLKKLSKIGSDKIVSERYDEHNIGTAKKQTSSQDDSIEQEPASQKSLDKLNPQPESTTKDKESKPVETVTPSSAQSSSLDNYQYVPKQTMSLKDLQLGFNQYLNNVGNTECLIQHGNTSAVPDGQSLKNITYKNQFAKTMIGSIHTHPKAKLIHYKMNKQLSFVITVDRKGKLLDIQITKESGDATIDRIIIESLQSAGLYPAVPSFIPDDPYVQQWTILY